MRDLALDLGISVVPDDAWGSEIVSSSLLHFAASTDPKYLICYTDLTDYVELKTADGFLERDGPNIEASGAPGLGLTLRKETLGDPVHVISLAGCGRSLPDLHSCPFLSRKEEIYI